MYTTYIHPQLEYCSALWSPVSGPLMDKIEKVQYDFTRLIPGICHLSYHDRLKTLNITSMERRYDRYKIFYMRKILLGQVPNVGIKVRSHENTRCGLKLEVCSKKDENRLRKASFQSLGPRTFNALPKDLRSLEDSMDTFKAKLDKFLELIPDRPRTGEGTKQIDNSLEFQLSSWNWRFHF